MASKTRIGIAAAAGLAAAGLAGCAVGLTPKGKPVLGLAVGEGGQLQAPDAVLDGIEDAAALLPAPWGQILAPIGVGIAGLAFGRERGRHTGWDERDADELRRSTQPARGGGHANGGA